MKTKPTPCRCNALPYPHRPGGYPCTDPRYVCPKCGNFEDFESERILIAIYEGEPEYDRMITCADCGEEL